jgi:predicted acetyltransferase
MSEGAGAGRHPGGSANSPIELVEPSLQRLPGYIAALQAGWSPNTTRDVSGEQLAAIRKDAEAFIRDLARYEGGMVTLADGARAPRLPGRVLWIWDGDFCGSINFRFVPGSEDLPPYVSGHVGYAVVPWKRNRGYARQALHLLLPIARGLGLPRLLVTCDEDNAASRRVIAANGGVSAGEAPDPEHAGKRKLLFWVNTGA